MRDETKPKPTEYGYKDTPEDLGRRMARKLFEKRGNHSEAHVTEADLAVMLEGAIRLYIITRGAQ